MPTEDVHPERPSPEPGRIDFVYTWIDGAHPIYQEQLRAHARSASDLNPERFRDSFSILKYSMRSVHQYVDWVGDVHVLTNRPQCPAWLDTSRDDVHLHYVEDLLDADCLPCFNSDAIETCLHLLETRSDYMVYMCDDYLFGRRTDLGDFVTPEGKIKVHGTWFGEYFPWRVYCGKWKLKSFPQIEHTPQFVYKPWYREMYESRPEELRRTRQTRFRSPEALKRAHLNNVFLLSQRRSQVEVVPGRTLLGYHRFHQIRSDFEAQVEGLRRLRESRPKFYCLNDDLGPHPDARVVELVREYLDQAHPAPSPWELSDEGPR